MLYTFLCCTVHVRAVIALCLLCRQVTTSCRAHIDFCDAMDSYLVGPVHHALKAWLLGCDMWPVPACTNLVMHSVLRTDAAMVVPGLSPLRYAGSSGSKSLPSILQVGTFTS